MGPERLAMSRAMADSLQVSVVGQDNEPAGELELPELLFGGPVKKHLLHEAGPGEDGAGQQELEAELREHAERVARRKPGHPGGV